MEQPDNRLAARAARIAERALSMESPRCDRRHHVQPRCLCPVGQGKSGRSVPCCSSAAPQRCRGQRGLSVLDAVLLCALQRGLTTEMARSKPPLQKSHRTCARPQFERIALLLQGGGALGSYQAGVYQALAEADLHPDWVAGISIGAINCGPHRRQSPRAPRGAFAAVLGVGVGLTRSACRTVLDPEGDLARSAVNQLRALGDSARRCATVLRAPAGAAVPASARNGRGAELLRCRAARRRRSSAWSISICINEAPTRFSVGRRQCPHRQLRLLRFHHASDPSRARHGQRLAATGLPRDRDRRRVLLGRRAGLQHAACNGCSTASHAATRWRSRSTCGTPGATCPATCGIARCVRRRSASPAGPALPPTPFASGQKLRRAFARIYS